MACTRIYCLLGRFLYCGWFHFKSPNRSLEIRTICMFFYCLPTILIYANLCRHSNLFVRNKIPANYCNTNDTEY